MLGMPRDLFHYIKFQICDDSFDKYDITDFLVFLSLTHIFPLFSQLK